MADGFEPRVATRNAYGPPWSTKSSSALNLSTPGDTRCKFIDPNPSRLGIVLVPHGTSGRHGKDKSRDFERNEKPACDLSRSRSICFAPFLSARARNAVGSVLPPFARRRRRARAFTLEREPGNKPHAPPRHPLIPCSAWTCSSRAKDCRFQLPRSETRQV